MPVTKEDVAADAVELASDTSELVKTEVISVAQNNPALLIGVALVSLTSGAVAGYLYAKKSLYKRFENEFEGELEGMRKFYEARARRNKEGEFATAESAAETLLAEKAAEALDSYQGKAPVDYTTPPEPEPEAVVVEEKVVEKKVRNVFVERPRSNDSFDYDEEIQHRTSDKPYVISFEEFAENKPDYIQNTITWYEGDEVLADEREEPIPDVEGTIGTNNIDRFGHGSKDPKIVYIRNERLDLDFEVVRHEGSYAEVVLGFTPERELRHSGSRRFRRGDDE